LLKGKQKGGPGNTLLVNEKLEIVAERRKMSNVGFKGTNKRGGNSQKNEKKKTEREISSRAK